MWYTRQTAEKQASFKRLVKNGQIEILMGGWSATDEAGVSYNDIINNMHIGHAWLKKEFGTIPKIGWMIDSFGHSTANAALFSDFGFDAIFLGRADEPQKIEMRSKNELQFVWRPFPSEFGKSKDIFSVFFADAYFPPEQLGGEGFVYYLPWSVDQPFQSDPTIDNYNTPEKIEWMVWWVT